MYTAWFYERDFSRGIHALRLISPSVAASLGAANKHLGRELVYSNPGDVILGLAANAAAWHECSLWVGGIGHVSYKTSSGVIYGWRFQSNRTWKFFITHIQPKSELLYLDCRLLQSWGWKYEEAPVGLLFLHR